MSVTQTERTVPAPASLSLAQLATQYATSLAQIMLDNGLTGLWEVQAGEGLNIKSPPGTWSPVYGLTTTGWNGQSVAPVVLICPEGQYAVSFTVTPSQWFDRSQSADSGGNWVGKISMQCSDGSAYSYNASPDVKVDAPTGTATQANGFPQVYLTSAGARVDSLLGVGAARAGKSILFTCPNKGLISGFSAGADPSAYPASWIVNLQFLCKGRQQSAAVGWVIGVGPCSVLHGA